MQIWRLEDRRDPLGIGGATDADGAACVRLRRAHVLGEHSSEEDGVPNALFSGWLEGSDLGDGVFAPDHRLWGPQPWAEFEAALARLAPRGGPEVWIRPHARHVLSDAQRCLTAARGWEERGLAARLLLEPAMLLTEAMLSHAEDHLERIFDTLGDSPRLAAVLLTGAEAVEADSEGERSVELRPCPLGRGLIDGSVLARCWKRSGASARPVILRGEEFDRGRGLLEA